MEPEIHRELIAHIPSQMHIISFRRQTNKFIEDSLSILLLRFLLKAQGNRPRDISRTHMYIPLPLQNCIQLSMKSNGLQCRNKHSSILQICTKSIRKQTQRSFKDWGDFPSLDRYASKARGNRPRDPSRTYVCVPLPIQICIKSLRIQTKRSLKDLCVHPSPSLDMH